MATGQGVRARGARVPRESCAHQPVGDIGSQSRPALMWLYLQVGPCSSSSNRATQSSRLLTRGCAMRGACAAAPAAMGQSTGVRLALSAAPFARRLAFAPRRLPGPFKRARAGCTAGAGPGEIRLPPRAGAGSGHHWPPPPPCVSHNLSQGSGVVVGPFLRGHYQHACIHSSGHTAVLCRTCWSAQGEGKETQDAWLYGGAAVARSRPAVGRNGGEEVFL